MLDLARWRANLTPNRKAVLFNNAWYTYAQLNERAEQLAGRLAEAGVKKGDRVGIIAYNHLCHLDLILAAPKLGFIYTPMNFRLSDEEQQGMAHYLQPSFMFHDRRHAEAAQFFDCPLQPLDGYNEWLDAAPPAPVPPHLTAEDTHMILQTGGSTGTPKGAQIPYRQVMFNALNTITAWGVTENDCAIQATPAFHAAINVLTLPLLYAGGRVVWMVVFDPNDYLQWSDDHGVTLWFLVPTMYQILCDHPDYDYTDHSKVRWAISGGAPCPEPIRRAFEEHKIGFKQGYGLTEAGVNCFAMEVEDAAERPDSVGKGMLTLQAVIRRPDGSRCAPDEIGELTLRGAQTFTGYYNKPEETAETLRDGWVWTGDLATYDDQGYYYIRGRRKEMYISGGENVYPKEVEDALYELDGIVECAVVGVPDPHWGETGLAAIVTQPGYELDRDTLRKELQMRLARYKVPREIMFVEELPKGAAGKILKFRVRQMYEDIQNEVSVGA